MYWKRELSKNSNEFVNTHFSILGNKDEIFKSNKSVLNLKLRQDNTKIVLTSKRVAKILNYNFPTIVKKKSKDTNFQNAERHGPTSRPYSIDKTCEDNDDELISSYSLAMNKHSQVVN